MQPEKKATPMGRYTPNPSYDHKIQQDRWDSESFQISWCCDRYISGSRLRFPTAYRRWTDRAGAERFAKKWGVEMPKVDRRG